MNRLLIALLTIDLLTQFTSSMILKEVSRSELSNSNRNEEIATFMTLLRNLVIESLFSLVYYSVLAFAETVFAVCIASLI